jgi:hypothetical protein
MGFTLPQAWQTLASGGTSWLQYRQGRENPGILFYKTSDSARF